VATRFYPDATVGVAPLAALGFDSATWDRTTDAVRHPMSRAKQNSALTNNAKQAGSTASPFDTLHYQYQSEPTPAAGTLTGTFRCRFMGFESNTACDAHPQVVVRVVSGDGSTVRGIAYAGGTQTTVSATVEFDTTASPGQNQRFPDTRDSNTLTSTAYEAGDRVIVEVGIRHIGAGAANQTATIRHGDPTASADLDETANSTTDGVPWIEFTHTFFPPSPAVAGSDITIDNTSQTSHVIDLTGTGAEDGDRLFVGVVTGRNNLSPGTTWPGGWTELSDTTNIASSSYTLSSAYLDVSGSPPTSVTVTTINDTTCVAIAYRIVDYDPAVPPEVTTAIDTANPPSITPSWGDVLGMVGTMLSSEGGGVTYPFADDQLTVTGTLPQIAGCTTNIGGTTTDPASWANVESGLNVLTFAVKAAEDSGITGAAAVTQEAQTSAASGQLGYSGTSATTQADQTSDASGTASGPATGTAAVTQADQTSAASGQLGYTGAAAVTQADQTSATTGQLGYTGASATTQAPQTSAASGALGYTGTAAATQADHVSAASGQLGYTGAAAVTQEAQTATATGTASGIGEIVGTAAVTQAAQTASAAGQLGYTGTAAVTAADNTSTASGQLGYTGTAVAVQASQTAAASGTFAGAITGLLAVTQANQTSSASGTFLPAGYVPPMAASYAEAFGADYAEQGTATYQESASATFRESA
jgi:hypothetical protein